MNSENIEVVQRKIRFLPSAPARFILAVFTLYALLNVLTINRGYIDFGDGNYLYISWRLATGARLYQDIVSPQPPMHLLVGKTLVSIGESFGGGMRTLALIRLFSILLHLCTAWAIMRISKILFGDEWISALSGGIFLFLPIGFFWAKGYQSEPLEIFFLTLAFWALLQNNPKGMGIAAFFSVLALFTNMTAVPYIMLFGVYALTCKRSLALPYLGILFAGTGILLLGFHQATGGTYIENVISNQVGTFPRSDPLGYAIQKIVSQSAGVLIAQGGIVLCSVMGAIVYLSQESLQPRKLAVWYLFWGLGSIVFVSKGGTEDYIFCLSEPIVAVFSAFFLRFFYLGTFSSWVQEKDHGSIGARLTRGATLLTFCLILLGRGSWEILETLSQGKYENTSAGVERVLGYVEKYSLPEDFLWAPPYYAFLTRHQIPEDASSTFIWYIRYLNHKFYGDPDLVVMDVLGRIVDRLDGEQVPVVVLNRGRGQLGSVDEIIEAVEKNYTLVDEAIPSRNERIRIYITRKKIPYFDLKTE